MHDEQAPPPEPPAQPPQDPPPAATPPPATPPPPAAPAAPAPAAPPPPAGDEKASGGMRALGLLLILLVAFGTAVMFVVALNPDDIPRCEEVAKALAAGECFDISSGQETVSTILAWPSAILGVGAVLVGLAFVFTGRRGRLFMQLVGAALVLGVLSTIVAQV